MTRVFGFILAAIFGGAGFLTAPAEAAPTACTSLRGAVPAHSAFLESYPGTTEAALKQTAFLYDNAVATIALVACGDRARAARIGDALMAALNHDRHWRDGRLRNAYLAGPIEKPVKLPGWWEASQNMWVEDQYQVGSDTGNQAWAMLALLALHKAGAGSKYLEGAKRIGTHVGKAFDKRAPSGFMGGYFGGEPRQRQERWKSTEHNVDLAAAFGLLADATKDPHWRDRSRQAESFVTAMWSAPCQCFAAGTGEDGKTRNPQLALDAQLWPILALPNGAARFSGAIRTAQKRLKDGDGFAYSDAARGVWTEGTAQAALLMARLGRKKDAADLLAAVERNRSKDGFYYATGPTALATGFMLETDPGKPRRYLRMPHLAALAWVALAEQRFNPFAGTR